jgi:hypothetical protein
VGVTPPEPVTPPDEVTPVPELQPERFTPPDENPVFVGVTPPDEITTDPELPPDDTPNFDGATIPDSPFAHVDGAVLERDFRSDPVPDPAPDVTVDTDTPTDPEPELQPEPFTPPDESPAPVGVADPDPFTPPDESPAPVGVPKPDPEVKPDTPLPGITVPAETGDDPVKDKPATPEDAGPTSAVRGRVRPVDNETIEIDLPPGQFPAVIGFPTGFAEASFDLRTGKKAQALDLAEVPNDPPGTTPNEGLRVLSTTTKPPAFTVIDLGAFEAVFSADGRRLLYRRKGSTKRPASALKRNDRVEPARVKRSTGSTSAGLEGPELRRSSGPGELTGASTGDNGSPGQLGGGRRSVRLTGPERNF